MPIDASNNCGCRRNRHPLSPYPTKHLCYCVIDAKEKQDVRTANIPRALLQTKSKGEVIIGLDQQMDMQLTRINPKYAKDTVEEKGQKVI